MPIYEYQCAACRERLEKIQGISDPPLQKCTKCGAEKGLRRLISSTSFVLKGTGWYATDYRNRGEKKSPKNKE